MDFSLKETDVTDPGALRESLSRLFRAQSLAVLSTSDEGQPYCSLVAFASTDDVGGLVFVTNRSTRKFANLVRDPRVSLLIDNRSNEEADFHDATAVTATGRAGEVPAEERGRLLKLYLGKHPGLEEFLRSPECALVEVRVSSYTVVSRFQQVTTLEIA